MGELSRRVKETASQTEDQVPRLSPREAKRAEKAAAAEAARLAKERAREAKRAEAVRVAELGQIVNTLRSSLKDTGDAGTQGFRRGAEFRSSRRLRLGRRPRGWIIGSTPLMLGLPQGPVEAAVQLLLLVDGRVYAAIDGVIGARYRFGQDDPPKTDWIMQTEVWRRVEDTVPETVGRLVGSLDLTWPLD